VERFVVILQDNPQVEKPVVAILTAKDQPREPECAVAHHFGGVLIIRSMHSSVNVSHSQHDILTCFERDSSSDAKT